MAGEPAVYHLLFFPPSKRLRSEGPQVGQVIGGLKGK